MSDDPTLEAAIDRAGRDRVLAYARAIGWREAPPKWVWWGIVAEIASGLVEKKKGGRE